jgi:hypothetical protein
MSYADHRAGLGRFPVLPLFSLNHMKKQLAPELIFRRQKIDEVS